MNLRKKSRSPCRTAAFDSMQTMNSSHCGSSVKRSQGSRSIIFLARPTSLPCPCRISLSWLSPLRRHFQSPAHPHHFCLFLSSFCFCHFLLHRRIRHRQIRHHFIYPFSFSRAPDIAPFPFYPCLHHLPTPYRHHLYLFRCPPANRLHV